MHGAGDMRLCLSPFDFYVNPLFVALERLWSVIELLEGWTFLTRKLA